MLYCDQINRNLLSCEKIERNYFIDRTETTNVMLKIEKMERVIELKYRTIVVFKCEQRKRNLYNIVKS